MLVTFANAVTFNSAAVTSGTGTVSSTTGSGTTAVTVNLTGVTNAQTITVNFIRRERWHRTPATSEFAWAFSSATPRPTGL